MIGFNGGLVGGAANARATSAVSAAGVWTLREQRRAQYGSIWPAVAGPLWTPANITTELWLDAADTPTVKVSAGAVYEWEDKSGNGFHAVQNTTSLRPLLSANSVNGLDSITFNEISPGTHSLATTCNISVSNTYMICFAGGNSTTMNSRLISSGSKTALITINRSSNTVYVNGAIQNGAWATVNTVNVGVLVAPASGNFQFYGNGTSYTNANKAVESWGTLGMGQVEPAAGRVCEVVVAYTASTATRELLEGYLAHKWGFESNLPAGHPYKTDAPTV
jgi:hypothetical protein